ncbi:ABC transporter ATP-binding protein [Desulfatiglans anilini]|uniref:ABC transporter ATP-binding protein n=1 Tax=Desulfatiglans anilini TaxID=90728 RepID=UPI000409B814|nr:ABC transporter ATP-binding protein [Desulfatiglans anilini]
MPLLEVENLSIGYHTRKGFRRAVEKVSFSLDAGRSLGFVGESGCGKTTLGMGLLRLLPPNALITEGRVTFDGTDLLDLLEDEMRKIRWKKISMIFQAAMNALNPVHRVADQIAEAMMAHSPGMQKPEAAQKVEALFQLVGIPKNRMRDYPHQYSGGMKQRAIIAMALSCRPKLIIADEPTTALDVIVQDQILEETRNLQREFGVAIIFISHDIAIVADVCHDIGIMYAGQLVEYGPRTEVFDHPVHPYTQALLASYPALTGPRARLQPIPGEMPNLINPPEGCRFCDRCPGATAACRREAPAWTAVGPGHHALCAQCR